MHARVVEPEILDSLTFDDPVAIANRDDLRLYNHLMGSFRWFANVLRQFPHKPGFIEVGSGDGSLGQHLLGKGVLSAETDYTGVDLIPEPPDWPWQWKQQDLLDCEYKDGPGVFLANLILHQFDNSDLRQLGQRLESGSVDLLVINEPVRRKLHLWQVSLSRIMRIHPITLQDARTSIRAGFRRDELVQRLGLDRSAWRISWEETFLGANRIICQRL